jgi:formylglycine-generating enzyme required for sulfatase activity
LVDALEGGSVDVEFDVQWDHSFRNGVNWDATWIIVKYRTDDSAWRHATLSAALADAEVRRDGGISAAVEPVRGGHGVFFYRAGPGTGPVRWRDARVQWDYAEDGVAEGSAVDVMVVGVEMVHVPAGAFAVGDGERGEVRGQFHESESAVPFGVESEEAVVLGGQAGGANSNNGYGMLGSFPDDFDENTPVTLPAAFPKGHAAFYTMKYELTQGLYAAFLNTLDTAQLRARNPAGNVRDLRPGQHRYTITTHAPFVASVPDRPIDNLSWMDAAAFADWAALRPMTEWEFEKAARGSAPATAGEFAWGTTNIHTRQYALVQIGTPQEHVGNPGVQTGNAAYVLTSGAADGCWPCRTTPLRAAAFRAPGATRQESGASFYGVMDLSGNLAERTVTVGNSVGRRFDGRHGDGHLGANGNAAGAETARWPGSSDTGSSTQIIGAVGTGLRGGGWNSPAANLRISDREFAAFPDNSRQAGHGYRFVRTAR